MPDFAHTRASLQDQKSYDASSLECDLVLKGGITSGVVYPLAVCELARTYRFRNLGGTSAGAIAAALAAAAEKGRATGGFARLAGLPEELGHTHRKRAKLLRLFQPQPATRHLFRFLLGTLETLKPTPRTGIARVLEIVLGLLVRGWLAYISRVSRFAVTAIAATFIVSIILANSFVPLWARIPAGILVFLLLEVFFLSMFLVFDLLRAVPRNGYGLCTGLEAQGKEPALTTWLANLLDEVSGQSTPLTFGDLWGKDDERREINLQVMTTSLTHARPYTIPFEARDLYFNPDEMRTLFPERIVRWMIDHARVSDTARDFSLYALPNPRDLPVIVAVRLSLSFPLLVSAVKLYTVDRTRPPERQVPEACWFSDGGISSNFPVHFFDAPLPHRPTFAINLRGFREPQDQSDLEMRNVFIPTNRRQGRFLTLGKITSLGNFLSQIFNTLQNWSDNTLVPVEGFRERIVHVQLNPAEGGANLNMDAHILERLAERGWCAGKTLVDKFGSDGGKRFDDHRWTRFTLSLATLQVWLEQFNAGYNDDFRRVITERRTTKTSDATDTALETVAGLHALVNDWDEKKVRFEVWHLARGESERTRRIEAELRIRPRL
jgi:Patatin-like phospholipase